MVHYTLIPISIYDILVVQRLSTPDYNSSKYCKKLRKKKVLSFKAWDITPLGLQICIPIFSAYYLE